MNTLEEIIEKFTCECNDMEHCCGCRYESILEASMCERKFIYEVASGITDINEPFSKIPSWFKVGAKVWRKADCCWITIKEFEVLTDGRVDLSYVCHCGKCGDEVDRDEFDISAFSQESPFPSWAKLGNQCYIGDSVCEIEKLHVDELGNLYINGEVFVEDKLDIIHKPSWVKDGQYVFIDKDELMAGWCRDKYVEDKIAKIDKEQILCKIADCCDDRCPFVLVAEDGFVDGEYSKPYVFFGAMKPVKFGKYSFEEAKELLEHKLELTSVDKNVSTCEIIAEVRINRDSNNEVYINKYAQGYLFDCNATVDGKPFGKPIIEE